MASTMEIERSAEEKNRYLQEMRNLYSKEEFYNGCVTEIINFLKEKNLPRESINELLKNDGIIYVQIDKSLRDMVHKLVLYLLTAIQKGKENIDLSSYKNDLIEIFSKFLDKKKDAALICDIALRNLLVEEVGECLKRTLMSDVEKKELLKVFSTVINNFQTGVRLRLAKKYKFDVFLAAETLSMAPLYPGSLSDISIHDLEQYIVEAGLSLNLFENVHNLLHHLVQNRIEENLLEEIKRKNLTSKAEIPKIINLPVPFISSETLKILKETIRKKSKDPITTLTENLHRVESEIEQKKNNLDSILSSQFLKVKDAFSVSDNSLSMERQFDYARRNITKLGSALRNLQRERNVHETKLKNLRSLSDISEAGIEGLLTKTRTSGLEDYLLVFSLLQQTFGKKLTDLPSDVLASFDSLIKDEILRLEANLKEKFDKIRDRELAQIKGLIREKRFFKKTYDSEGLKNRYIKIFENVIAPSVVTKRLEALVRIWPPMVADLSNKGSLLDEARYIGEELEFNDRLYHLDLKDNEEFNIEEPSEELRRCIVDNFTELVSVLIYDIRGSSFMGNKLKDASVESEIRNKFNIKMLDVASDYGAFALKDTGDGGIIFFSANSNDLFNNCFDFDDSSHLRVGKTAKESVLVPSADAAKRAVGCACDMVKMAEHFVHENLKEYARWFKEEKDRKLIYAGVTYAELPPEYKKIFQIGVGISSGKPHRDVYFDINSYGEFDLTGNLVREANFYSKAKDPQHSVILCDSATLLNFLLNIEKFEPEEEETGTFSELATDRLDEMLRSEVKKFAVLKKEKKGYKFKTMGVYIEKIGLAIVYDKKRYEPLILQLKNPNVKITDSGEFIVEKIGQVKFLYEVLPEGVR